jgi:hypothetical protein
MPIRASMLFTHLLLPPTIYVAAGKPFSDWVSQLASGEVQPVKPTTDDTAEWMPQVRGHALDCHCWAAEKMA